MSHECLFSIAVCAIIFTSGCSSTVEPLEERIEKLENALKSCKTTSPGKPTGNVSGPVVAFSAYLSGSINHVASYEVFVYEHVTLNEGSAYNVHVGRFQAPVVGIYHFVATAQSQSSDNLEFELVRDGIALCRARGSQSTGTCATTVHLNTNSDVWVRHYSSYGSYVYGSAYAVFTGHLVHAD